MKKVDEDIVKLSQLAERHDKLKIGKIGSFERNLTESVARKEVNIESLTINFKETSIIENKVEAFIPENFALMDEEMIKAKYPQNQGGGVVYTNEIASVDCIFSINEELELNDSDLPYLKEEMVKMFRQVHYGAKFYEEGLDNFTGKDITFFDFLFDATGIKMYTLMAITSLDGKMFLMSFNCTEKDMKYWKPMFKGIIKSVKITES